MVGLSDSLETVIVQHLLHDRNMWRDSCNAWCQLIIKQAGCSFHIGYTTVKT